MTKSARLIVAASGLCALAAFTTPASAEIREYYVGLDARSTPFNAPAAVGGGAYPDAPNFNRLTFLYSDPIVANPASNHYHSIGVFNYSGPAASPTLNTTSGNNRVPEISTGLSLFLQPGEGAFAGRLRTVHDDQKYSDFTIQPVFAMDGFAAGTPEHFMFNSSGGRWTGDFSNSAVRLELLSITPGLGIADESGSPLFSGGVNTVETLGTGHDWSWTPVFHTVSDAAIGRYTAEFRLHDGNASTTGILSGGNFFVDVTVPEPTGLAGVVAVAAVTLGRRRRA